MKIIRLFLASSNDMLKHRKIVQEIVDEVNQTIGEEFEIYIQLFRWENKIIPSMGRPQEIIFQQSDFDNIDIFIGVIGSRFGSLTGATDGNNIEYESGTQEEYERAYRNYKKNGKPYIMIFRDITPLKQEKIDIEQYNKVQSFFEKFEANNSNPGIFLKTKNKVEFEKKVRITLIKTIFSIVHKFNNEEKDIECFSSKYMKLGYKKMFINETNSLRSHEKNKAIKKSNVVYLLSKTGNSFIGYVGNSYYDFYDLLIENIEKYNASVKILLLNPWTINSVLTAFTEDVDSYYYLKYINKLLPAQQIIEAYKKTQWFQTKLNDVLQGYKVIKKNYPQIELRFVDADITASVLLTDSTMFYEPYSNYVSNSRLEKKLSSFEIEISKENPFYKVSMDNFKFLWKGSISYDDIIENEEVFENRLANILDSMYLKNTSAYVGVHVLIKKENKFLILRRASTKTYMPLKWDLPGGILKQGEELEETAKRKVKEETGLDITIKKIIYAFSNKVELPEKQTIQLIYEGEFENGDIKLDKNEHDTYYWAKKDELKSIPLIDYLDSFIFE